ncbi:MAG: YhjD/YihY/BrkB family envelope integrity protein [Limisphaerales bacterium]
MTGGDTGTEQEPNRVEQFAHFCVLVGKSFGRNRCPVRAAALSFATLLALIPMLAVAISVTSSLLKQEGEDKIYGFIDQIVYSLVPPAGHSGHTNSATRTDLAITTTNVPAATDLATHALATTNVVAETATDDNGRVAGAQKEAAKRIHEFIQKTQSGALGVVGMMVLVFVAIRMLANIEETFNDIWGVTQGRSWLSRIILYWTTITLGPLLLAGALALASSPHFQATKGAVNDMPVIGGLIFLLLPLVVSWLVFALIYQLVPHTKIHFGASLVGGIVGGTLWHLNNVFGFLFVSRLMSNSKIYGSLFLLPVFMAGIYFSWLILLFGAQVAYAFQNRKAYLQDKLVENVNQRGREFIALRLMTCICQRFQNHLPPVTLPKISTELGIPTRLAQQVLRPLLAARLVVETGGSETAYTTARPLETITAHHVLHAMRTGGGQELPMRDGPVRAEVLGEFARIEEAEHAAASAITMHALVSRTSGKLEIPAPGKMDK